MSFEQEEETSSVNLSLEARLNVLYNRQRSKYGEVSVAVSDTFLRYVNVKPRQIDRFPELRGRIVVGYVPGQSDDGRVSSSGRYFVVQERIPELNDEPDTRYFKALMTKSFVEVLRKGDWVEGVRAEFLAVELIQEKYEKDGVFSHQYSEWWIEQNRTHLQDLNSTEQWRVACELPRDCFQMVKNEGYLPDITYKPRLPDKHDGRIPLKPPESSVY